MTGYQEVLTDPSYAGQMVCMTYPLQGNYGVRDADAESARPWARALVVRWACPSPSHHSSEASLDEYLRRWNVPAIAEIDTRALTRHIRTHGALRALLVHEPSAPSERADCGAPAPAARPALPTPPRAQRVVRPATSAARARTRAAVGTGPRRPGPLREHQRPAAPRPTDAGVNLEQARAETLRLR